MKCSWTSCGLSAPSRLDDKWHLQAKVGEYSVKGGEHDSACPAQVPKLPYDCLTKGEGFATIERGRAISGLLLLRTARVCTVTGGRVS